MSSDPRFERYRLLWSRCEGGEWTAPQPPPFAAAAGIHEGDPFVTPDGRRLYYISMRGKAARSDDFDIWYVERTSEHEWTEPRRMPEPVNSAASELLPRADATGRLYFGSARPGGQGQGDIYTGVPQADGSWRVENVGPPVSTAAFEYEAEISRDGRTMIVVADRGDRSHLYRFVQRDGRWVEQDRVPAACERVSGRTVALAEGRSAVVCAGGWQAIRGDVPDRPNDGGRRELAAPVWLVAAQPRVPLTVD